MTSRQLTIGIVGAGRWGRRLATAFGKHGKVAAFCHLGRASTREWIEGEFPEATVTDRLSNLLGDDQIDAIAVVTPISTHADITSRALTAGKHVFVEKPLATSANVCAALVENAEARGLALFTGHVFLYDPVFNELRRIASTDPVTAVKTSWHKYGTFDEDLVLNLMTHELAIGIGLFGTRPVAGRILYSRGLVSKSDASAASLSFGGADDDLLVEVDRCAPVEAKSVTAKTESGRILIWSGDTLYECDKEGPEPIFTRPDVQPLDIEVGNFARQVRLGEAPLTDGRFGMDVVSAVELIRC